MSLITKTKAKTEKLPLQNKGLNPAANQNSFNGKEIASRAQAGSNTKEQIKDLRAKQDQNKQQTEETQQKGYRYLKDRSKLEQKIVSVIRSDFCQKKLSMASNTISFLGNAYASIMSLLPSVSKENKESAFQIGSYATKTALIINGTLGGLNQIISRRNIFVGMGQLIDNINSFIFPFNRLYLGRGLSYGLNVMGVALNRGAKLDEFKSFGHWFKSIVPGIKKIFNDLKSPLKNYANAESGLMCFVHSLSVISGALIGLNTPFLKLGASIRNIAGTLQDLDRFKAPVEQPLYFKSGICHLIGSTLNLMAKFVPNYEKLLIPLGFIADTFGRDLWRQSLDNGEMVVKVKKSIFDLLASYLKPKAEKSL